MRQNFISVQGYLLSPSGICWVLQKINVEGRGTEQVHGQQPALTEQSLCATFCVSFLYLFAHLILPRLSEETPVGPILQKA